MFVLLQYQQQTNSMGKKGLLIVSKLEAHDSNPFDKREVAQAELLVTVDFLTTIANMDGIMAKKLAIWLQKTHDGSEYFKVKDSLKLLNELGYEKNLKPNLYQAVAELVANSLLAKSSKRGCFYVNNKLLNL